MMKRTPLSRRLAAATLAISLVLAAGEAAASEAADQTSRYTLWVPDEWTVEKKTGGIIARDATDTVRVVTGLAPNAFRLEGEGIRAFVDDELAAVTVDSDRVASGKWRTHLLSGTATSRRDGVKVAFDALAIEPGGGQPVIELLVYGRIAEFRTRRVQGIIKKIERSFAPK
jgi:hypothetical protein